MKIRRVLCKSKDATVCHKMSLLISDIVIISKVE